MRLRRYARQRRDGRRHDHDWFSREPRTMTRLGISSGMPFDEFRAAFEKAAPAFDPATTVRILEKGNWDDGRAAAAAKRSG
jgi:hypothetical protein